MTPDELVEAVTDAMLQEDNYYVSRDHARAAIRIVLEEAAKVAAAAEIVEDVADDNVTNWELSIIQTTCSHTAQGIAAAIRDLMPEDS